jgi:MFS family permease
MQASSRWLLPVLLGGQTMASMDGSIVNVALPAISRDLHASGALLQITVAAYLVAYAVLLVAGARLGDSVGHRALFVTGLALFTAASLACGASPAIWVLVAARAVQGGAAALMVPQVLSLIQRSFTGGDRTRALSQYSAVLALGVAAGQALGGVLVAADVLGSTWRAVFLVNVPAGLVLLVAARRHLPPGAGAGSRRFDVAGMLALAAATLLLIVPLAVGRETGWPRWSVVCLVLVAPALAVFVAVEWSRSAPLVDLRLLREPVVAIGLAAIVAVMAGFAAFLFMFTLHLQAGLGYSPLRSSLTFLPYAVGFGTASLNWRLLPNSWREWAAPAGFVLLAAAWAALALSAGGGVRPEIACPLLFLAGAGHAAAFAPLTVAVMARARPDQASSLSGMLSTGTTLAAVVGVAIGGGAYLSAARQSGTTEAFQIVLAGLATAMLVAGAGAVRAARPRAVARIARATAGRD